MIQRRPILAALLSAMLMVSISPSVAQTSRGQEADTACASPALGAVADSVAEAFDDHQFVFFGSTHGGAKMHDFLLCLLSRRAFQQRATDVLVEFANPVHQQRMDRYLLALEPVPEDSLQQVWFDTGYPQLWTRLPQIPAFFAAVRALNERLDPSQRIRVLGGNAPVDWAAVPTAEDLARYPFKTNYAAHVITEHFAVRPDQRLLVVYGEGHIHHNGGTLMSDVEAKVDPKQLFVVGTIRDLDADESERVARFGDPAHPFFVGAQDFPSTKAWPDDLFYADSGALDNYIDALIYLGPEADRTLSKPPDLTEAQRTELSRRAEVKSDPGLLQSRFRHRDEWFRTHPKDIPERL